MPRLPDSSDFYTAERALHEEVQWLLSGEYKRACEFVLPRLDEYDVKTVLELGCGSGLFGLHLPDAVKYTGVDKNPHFLAKARKRHDRRQNTRLVCFDLRNYQESPADLVCCFGTLKHFAFDEWDRILYKVLSMGRYAAFDVQEAPEEFDDGKDFHHVFVMEERTRRTVEAAGHKIVTRQEVSTFAVPGKCQASSVMYWTEKVVRDVVEVSAVETQQVPAETAPLTKYRQHLEVGGLEMTALEDYSLRWVAVPGGAHQPVLYHHGRRVTEEWSLAMEVALPKDEKGASA